MRVRLSLLCAQLVQETINSNSKCSLWLKDFQRDSKSTFAKTRELFSLSSSRSAMIQIHRSPCLQPEKGGEFCTLGWMSKLARRSLLAQSFLELYTRWFVVVLRWAGSKNVPTIFFSFSITFYLLKPDWSTEQRTWSTASCSLVFFCFFCERHAWSSAHHQRVFQDFIRSVFAQRRPNFVPSLYLSRGALSSIPPKSRTASRVVWHQVELTLADTLFASPRVPSQSGTVHDASLTRNFARSVRRHSPIPRSPSHEAHARLHAQHRLSMFPWNCEAKSQTHEP